MLCRIENCGERAVRTQDRYLLSLAITYAATNFLLALNNVSLDLYVSAFIVEYFILTLLNSPLYPKAQRLTSLIGYVLFGVFILIVAFKILEILGGVKLL
jgi:hypothetical protein